MANDLARRTERLLVVPDKFRQTALAFPEQIDAALALIGEAGEATELLARTDVLAQYARRVKADTEVMNAINYCKIKIVAKIGELTPAATKAEAGSKGGDAKAKKIASLPTEPASRAEPSMAKETVAKYRKVATNIGQLEKYKEACGSDEELTTNGFIRFATGTEKAGTAAHVSANTGVPEWYTPPAIIEAARKVLGSIDLDPASSAKAQETVQAGKYYTLDDDGLAKKWKGRVWLNPPYSSDFVGKFVAKLCAHVERGDVPAALLLINNATETKWFQQAALACLWICFPAGRIKFLDETGEPKGAPLQGQAMLYFGDADKSFVKEFSSIGFCVKVHHA